MSDELIIPNACWFLCAYIFSLKGNMLNKKYFRRLFQPNWWNRRQWCLRSYVWNMMNIRIFYLKFWVELICSCNKLLNIWRYTTSLFWNHDIITQTLIIGFFRSIIPLIKYTYPCFVWFCRKIGWLLWNYLSYMLSKSTLSSKHYVTKWCNIKYIKSDAELPERTICSSRESGKPVVYQINATKRILSIHYQLFFIYH